MINLSRFVFLRSQGASIDAPIANDIFGSQQSGTTQTVQKSDPWGGVQPYMLDIFGRSQQLANTPSLAGQSPQTLQAQDLQAQRALSGSPLTQAAQNQNLATVRGDYLDLSKNPAAQSAMDMARSQINSQFKGDNFGNSAHQEWLGRGLIGAAAPFYESERNRQQQATSLAPGLAANDYADIGQLGAVGAAKDARAQQVNDFPWQTLFNYQRAIAGTGANGGTSTSEQPYFTNPLANTLGTAIGIGQLGTLFSDRMLKRDIRQIGTHPIGIPLYSFKYLWSDAPQVGVMADEVRKVKPEAVGEKFGFQTVDYAMLGA